MFKTPKQRAQYLRWAVHHWIRSDGMRAETRKARDRRVLVFVRLANARLIDPSPTGDEHTEISRYIRHGGALPSCLRTALASDPLGAAFLRHSRCANTPRPTHSAAALL